MYQTYYSHTKNFIRLSAKLKDPSTARKTNWSILNKSLSNKKIPIIPFILVDGKVVSNFAKKAELFDSYFASQCTPVINKSQLASLEFKTSKRIEKITFTDDYINQCQSGFMSGDSCVSQILSITHEILCF